MIVDENGGSKESSPWWKRESICNSQQCTNGLNLDVDAEEWSKYRNDVDFLERIIY